MTPAQAAATAVTTLSETFRQPLTDAAVEGYIAGLEDLPEELIRMALRRALRECRFMPTPAELREMAGAPGAKAAMTKAIADAWEAVVWAIRKHSYTESVDFGPLVNAVIRNMGGWQAACGWGTAERDTWKRKEFASLFEAFSTSPPASLRGEPLAGAFGGRVYPVAIAGAMPERRLAAVPNEAAQMIRELAEAKSW